MSNPIWAMLIGVGVGLAVSLYVYYQEQRSNGQSYGNGRAPNRGDTSRIDWERPDPTTSGSRGPRTSRRNDSPESKSKDPCIICMDENSGDAWRILTCEHRFHVKCVAKWFNESRSCPTCRKPVGSSYWA